MNPRRPVVAVVGDGSLPEDHPRVVLAEEIGERLVSAGCRILTGGRDGVMAAACRGAQRSPHRFEGSTIGLLPGFDPRGANPWTDIALPTGLGHARNVLVAQADAVVAIGGGAGTLSEIAQAWIHNRMIIALRCGGWSQRVADARLDDRARSVGPEDDRVWGADTADQVILLLDAHLPEYVAS